MPSLVIVLLCVLSLIGLVFLYVFLFRLPSAQLQADQRQQLQALYADDDPDTERSSLILTSRSVESDLLEAQLIWLDGYEVLDPLREVLSDSYEAYQQHKDLRWREDWLPADALHVQQQSRAAFEEKLMQMQVKGWVIALEIPFSPQDHLVYLRRNKPAQSGPVSG